MPNEIDRTQVVIETTLDDREADKKIEQLERKLNNLQETRDINISFDVDKAIQALQRKIREVNVQITENIAMGKGSQNGPLNKQYKELTNIWQHVMEDRNTITAEDINDILSSVGLKLDGTTISELSESVNQDAIVSEIQDATDSVYDIIMEWNAAVNELRAAIRKGQDTKAIEARLNEIASILKSKGVDTPYKKDGTYAKFNPQAQQTAMNNAQQSVNVQKSSGLNAGKIAGAIVGIRSIFMFIKRIASQNENLMQAVQNLVDSLATILKPLFDFLALVINTIAQWLAKVFGVEVKTNKSVSTMSKQLASFDEINNIGGSSGGGAGSANSNPNVGTLDWLGDILTGLWEMIKGTVDSIVGFIAAAIMGLIGLAGALVNGVTAAVGLVTSTIWGVFKGLISGIPTLISGLWKTITDLFTNLWKTITGTFTSFSEGFNRAMENGSSVIGAIFSGLWEALKSFFSGLWKTVSTLFSDIFKTLGSSLTNFWNGFKTGFSTVFKWFNDTLIAPLGKALQYLWDNVIKPLMDKWNKAADLIGSGFKNVINGFKGMINSVIKVINKIPGVNIPLLANGGYVPNGQMFIAREAGPEMVGSIGGQTAVANNAQIVSAVSKGVAEAVRGVLGNGGGDQTIQLFVDGKQMSDVVIRNIQRQQRVMGGGLF